MRWDKVSEEVCETAFLKQLKKYNPLEEVTYRRVQSIYFLWVWKWIKYVYGDPVYIPTHRELQKKSTEVFFISENQQVKNTLAFFF